MTLYDKIKEMNIEDMASAIAKIASNCYDCGGCHVGDQWSDEPAIYYWDSEEEENGRD